MKIEGLLGAPTVGLGSPVIPESYKISKVPTANERGVDTFTTLSFESTDSQFQGRILRSC